MSLPPNQVKEAPPVLELTDAQLEILDTMSEWFIGPVDGFPTVAEADPENAVLRMALEQLSPLHAEITAAIDGASGLDVAAYLSDLEARGTPAFEILRTLLIGRYLSCRPVWKILGYSGRRPIPIRPGEAEEYLPAELLAPVRARGKIYRPTP